MVMASHCVGFTLPGMIEEPGSFSGMCSSPRPQRGPEASQRMSLAIFMSEPASVVMAPWANTSSSCAESAANLLGCERNGRCVSSAILRAARSANSGCALRPVPTAVPPMARSYRPSSACSRRATVAFEQAGPAAKLLPDGERRGILQMRAADFHHVGELLGLGVDGVVARSLHCRNQRAVHALGSRDVHGRGKRVVGRLRHVDVIVGMNGLFAAHHAAGKLDGAIGDDFVGVHVGLRAAAGLPDAQRKMIVEFAGNHFVGGLSDEPRLFLASLPRS